MRASCRALRVRRGLAGLSPSLALGGCHSLSAHPPTTARDDGGQLARGHAASDDFERQAREVIAHERQRLQPRHGRARCPCAAPAARAAATRSRPWPCRRKRPDKERKRLADDLRPAASLRIAFAGEPSRSRATRIRCAASGRGRRSRASTAAAPPASRAAGTSAPSRSARATPITPRAAGGSRLDTATDTLHLRFQATTRVRPPGRADGVPTRP